MYICLNLFEFQTQTACCEISSNLNKLKNAEHYFFVFNNAYNKYCGGLEKQILNGSITLASMCEFCFVFHYSLRLPNVDKFILIFVRKQINFNQLIDAIGIECMEAKSIECLEELSYKLSQY